MLGNLYTAPKSFYDFFSFVTDPTVGCVCNEEKGVQLHVLPRDVGHHQAPDKDENTLYQKLSEELKKKRKLNTSAITQILELTFKKGEQ